MVLSVDRATQGGPHSLHALEWTANGHPREETCPRGIGWGADGIFGHRSSPLCSHICHRLQFRPLKGKSIFPTHGLSAGHMLCGGQRSKREVTVRSKPQSSEAWLVLLVLPAPAIYRGVRSPGEGRQTRGAGPGRLSHVQTSHLPRCPRCTSEPGLGPQSGPASPASLPGPAASRAQLLRWVAAETPRGCLCGNFGPVSLQE